MPSSTSASTRFLNPPAIAKPGGYSHVVEVVGPGRIVYTAGQLGLKPDGTFADGFLAQAEQAFLNLKAALEQVAIKADRIRNGGCNWRILRG